MSAGGQYELLPNAESSVPPAAVAQSNPATAAGPEGHVVDKDPRRSDSPASIAALTSAAVLAVFTWLIVLTNDPFSLGLFPLHPLLQTLSIALFTYGIITLQTTTQPETKASGLKRHQQVMFMLGFPAMIIGTLVMLYQKWSHGASHFTTWHGWFGFLSAIWMIGQVILGGGSVWFGGAAFGGEARAKAIYKLSGYLLFVCLLWTAYLAGAWSNWTNESSSYIVRLLAYTLAPIGIIAGISLRIRPSKMKFF